MRKSLADRFWEKVERSDPLNPEMESCCWEWQRHRDREGYGRLWVRGKSQLAHVIAWELATGYPPTKDVCHRCDNRACVRFSHLSLGTHQENIIDAAKKNRLAHKLTTNDVVRVREMAARGMPRKEIASIFKVSYWQICNILNGRSRRCVNRGTDTSLT